MIAFDFSLCRYSVKMLELDRALIVWRLQGSNSGGKVDVRVTTELTLNIITGRAMSVVESWDVSGCDAGAGYGGERGGVLG